MLLQEKGKTIYFKTTIFKIGDLNKLWILVISESNFEIILIEITPL